MKIISHQAELRESVKNIKNTANTLVFVPTMGNLHAGHLHLLKVAKQHGDCVALSIFVNPLQFGEGSDYDSYPKTLEKDLHALQDFDVDIVFTPQVKDIYPQGLQKTTKVEVPGLSDLLCGEFRRGHFIGVATVVTKLFNLVQPDVAVFGEKDFQQLVIIKQMVKDLCMPIHIVGVETQRENNGLALSSRNQYLSKAERTQATHLFRVLQKIRQQILASQNSFREIEFNATRELDDCGFRCDYVRIIDESNLQAANSRAQSLRIVAAAWLGKARLIDNIVV